MDAALFVICSYMHVRVGVRRLCASTVCVASDAVVVVCGQGSFGQVVSAIDTSTGGKVAVKVIKNREAFR